MTNFILTERLGPVGIITLNRPEILNAWHRAMRDELVAALERFDLDESVRAIILTGAGERAFGAGQDLLHGFSAVLDATCSRLDRRAVCTQRH